MCNHGLLTRDATGSETLTEELIRTEENRFLLLVQVKTDSPGMTLTQRSDRLRVNLILERLKSRLGVRVEDDRAAASFCLKETRFQAQSDLRPVEVQVKGSDSF